MTPVSELAPPGTGERHCAVSGCRQPPCFRICLARPAGPCGCAPSTAGACAAHLVDAIHQLAQSARARCPHPAEVTVYVADQPASDPRSAPYRGFAFTTFRVPGRR